MNAAFDDYRRIARLTTVQRDAGAAAVMKSIAGLLALTLAAGVLIAVYRGQLELELGIVARAAVGLAGLWLAIVWSMLYVPGSLLVHSAVNARLLPRQRRRLMQMTAAGWLLCTLAAGIAFGSWAALPAAGAYLIGLPLMMSGHRRAVGMMVAAFCWPLASGWLPASVVQMATGTPALTALTVLLLPAGWVALRLLYPNGGDAFLDGRAEQLKRLQRSQQGRDGTFTESSPAASRVLRLYAALLRRDARQGDPATLLMHALGPQVHWTAWLASMSVLLVIAIGMHIVLVWHGADAMRGTVTTVTAGATGVMTMLVLFGSAAIGQQMRRTGGEQALLRLSPRAGAPALLNRRLASRLLTGALRLWLGQVALILLATWLIGGDAAALLRQFALCCLAGQVSLMGLLGDYAGDGGWTPMLAWRAALVAIVEAVLAAALGWSVGPSAWPWLILIAGCAAVVQVRLGWQRMLAAPVAFPAGRLV